MVFEATYLVAVDAGPNVGMLRPERPKWIHLVIPPIWIVRQTFTCIELKEWFHG
jgi:hypothetical protein